MATEESEFNTKVKNEIVYTFDTTSIKAKKGNFTVNNNKNLNHINKTRNKLSFGKNKYKKITKAIKYMNLTKGRLKFKYNDKIINKQELKNNLFNNYIEQSNQLPPLNLLKRHYNENTEIIDSKSKDKNSTFLKVNKRKTLFDLKKNKKNNTLLFNYDYDDNKKDKKTIINFFSKKDNDFYY